MTWKFSSIITYTFAFFFFSFLAVHYAHMKSLGQYRELASKEKIAQPWYDASFKY